MTSSFCRATNKKNASRDEARRLKPVPRRSDHRAEARANAISFKSLALWRMRKALGALRRQAGINPAPTNARAHRLPGKSHRDADRAKARLRPFLRQDRQACATYAKAKPKSPTLTKRAWDTRKGQTLKQGENAWLSQARPDHSRALQRQRDTQKATATARPREDSLPAGAGRPVPRGPEKKQIPR